MGENLTVVLTDLTRRCRVHMHVSKLSRDPTVSASEMKCLPIALLLPIVGVNLEVSVGKDRPQHPMIPSAAKALLCFADF